MQKWSCSQALKIKDQLAGGDRGQSGGRVGGVREMEGTHTTSVEPGKNTAARDREH